MSNLRQAQILRNQFSTLYLDNHFSDQDPHFLTNDFWSHA